jgi:hypothetical protein
VRRLLPAVGAILLTLMLASPATAAETFIVTCHVCDKVDVEGSGELAQGTAELGLKDFCARFRSSNPI